MKRTFENPVAELFELSSDEIMGTGNGVISADIIDFPKLPEENESDEGTFLKKQAGYIACLFFTVWENRIMCSDRKHGKIGI